MTHNKYIKLYLYNKYIKLYLYNKYINMNINMNMNKTSIMSIDKLKSFGQGALGTMSFSAYHQYITNKIMEINNESLKIQQQIDKQEEQYKSNINNLKSEYKYKIEKEEREHKIEMDELKNELRNQNDKINKLLEENKKSKWW